MSLNRLLVTLVRHGESQDNSMGIWAGFRDTPLTQNGINQARALGQSFANVPLTAIYCSDLKRAAMTAEEILKSNRSIPPPPLVQSKTLREINFGQAEGQTNTHTEWIQGSTGDDGRKFRFPQGECLEEVNARIAKAVRQFILPRVEALRKKPPTQQHAAGDLGHICIVAHGIAIAELLRVFMSLHDGSPNSPWPDPKLSYQRVRLENTGWSRLELAVPFQGDDTSPVEAQPTPLKTSFAHYADFGGTANDLSEASTDVLGRPVLHHDLSSPSLHVNRSGLGGPEAAARPIYVKILCQNQTDHLHGSTAQPSSMSSAAKAVAHLAGGGASKPAPASNPAQGSALAQPTSAGATSSAAVGLPSSATLASIASNATSSHSHSTAAMTPSTPAAGASQTTNGTSKNSTTTPASARNLLAYDARMMTRELERAGATAMLSGSEAGASGVMGSSYYPSSGSTSTLAADRTASSVGLGAAAANASIGGTERSAFNTSPAVGSALNSSAGASQSGTSGQQASTLFGSYPQTGSASVPGAASPNPGALSFNVGPSISSDTWQMICIRVLPLFNGEPLRTSIEELNEMVTLHIRKTLERSQTHAIESLTLDLLSLTSTGTLTLNSKLQGLDDQRLLLRLVEVWTFFLGQVLPYCEGCFLPLRTDPALRNLVATSGSYGAANGTAGIATSSSSAGLFSAGSNLTQSGAALLLSGAPSTGMDLQLIDVRKVLMVVFRDQVLMPIYERLFQLFAHLTDLDPAFAAGEDAHAAGGGDDGIKQVSLRLLQMTSVLAGILSEDQAQEAMDNLLRALRLGSKSPSAGRSGVAGDAPGARSASPSQRNNRRGWMAQKARKHGVTSNGETDIDRSLSGLAMGPGQSAGKGFAHAMQAGPDGHAHSAQHAFLKRPSQLTNFRDPLGSRYGPAMTEDEYLTSLRSPAGSPAISTPGQPQTPAIPSTEGAVASVDHAFERSQHEDGGAVTPVLGRATSPAINPIPRQSEQPSTAPALAA